MTNPESNPHVETLQELAQDPTSFTTPVVSAEISRLSITDAEAKQTLQAALELQHQQNIEAEEFVAGLPLSQELKDEIEIALGQRGGQWLEFVENLTGYKGKSDTSTE